MAETKFTPGPWETGQASWNEDGEVQYTLHGIHELRVADAHLIAAAPELYEALERLIKAGTDAFNAMSHYAEVNNTTNAVSHNLSGALDFGLFQLAKARGEAV